MPLRRYLVSGRVQGVGFRWFVLEEAATLGLRGHVRNLSDGRVEVVAQGPQAVLEDFEASLRRGPRHAAVTGVDVVETSDQGSLPSGFHITR